MRRLGALLRDTRAAGAAEFALVLPLLLLLLLGMFDAGRYMWEYNRAEKATQVGARAAVVSDLVPAALAGFSFVTDDSDPVMAGNPVPAANFESVLCDDTDCDPCTGGDVCGDIGYDAVAFGEIVDRMRAIYPQIDDDNVEIEYRNVGLGFSGDPGGPDVAPLVTVSLKGLEFRPVTTLLLARASMPDFRASLTLEDGAGDPSDSN